MKTLGIIIVGIVSLLPTVINRDLFSLRNGYSFVWIALMYLLGGIIKKVEFGRNIRKSILFLTYLLAVLVTWGAKFVLERHPMEDISPNLLYSYSSITMLICAIALLLLFSRLEIKGRAAWIIKKASPLAFSVYIIHANQLVWSNWLASRYTDFGGKTPVLLAVSILAAALFIYVVCSLLDAVRAHIFKVLKVGERCKKLLQRISFTGKLSE